MLLFTLQTLNVRQYQLGNKADSNSKSYQEHWQVFGYLFSQPVF